MSIDCYCDYAAPEFWSISFPKARKTHRCYECSGEIRLGERYEYSAGKVDGYFDQYHICRFCRDIRVWLQNSLTCFCYLYGGLKETAEEAIDYAYERAPEEVVGLRFGYLRRRISRDRFNAHRRAS